MIDFFINKFDNVKVIKKVRKIKMEEIKSCSWCQEPTEKLFYNYKNMPLCKECLDRILKETRKTLNYVRNFVSA